MLFLRARGRLGRSVLIACGALLSLSAASGLVLSVGGAQAGDKSAPKTAQLSFAVPADYGYGIADCLTSKSDCGRVMATSWCEAHGHAKAVAFGSADDVTGSIGNSDKVIRVANGAIVIQCGD